MKKALLITAIAAVSISAAACSSKKAAETTAAPAETTTTAAETSSEAEAEEDYTSGVITAIDGDILTVKDDYDYVIIDTNPSLDNLPINALTASDKVVITVQAEPYAVEGMADLLRSINMVKRNLNHDLKIEGVLITMTNERTNLSKKITHEVRENFGGHIKVFDTTIPRCTKAAESTGIGESIFQYDPKGAATKAYEAFTKEVILNAEKEHKRHKSSYVR